MNREVQAVLLVLLGGAVLRISLTDVHLRYVKPEFAPALIVGGAVLLALGLVGVLLDRAPTSGGDGHPDGDGHGPGAGPRVAWLLLLPVLAIFLVAPPALGSYAAARDAGTVADPGPSDYPPLPAGDPVETSVLDYATRAVWDQGRTLTGRTVRITGFVSPAEDGAASGDAWFLTRIALSCCAGDGRAFKIKVIDGADAPPLDAWVEVTGEYVPTDVPPGDDVIPALRALQVRTVPPPRNPYDEG